jgi:hypothetical protein
MKLMVKRVRLGWDIIVVLIILRPGGLWRGDGMLV